MGRYIKPSTHLPGNILSLNTQEVCDTCGQPAVAEVVGETDSFGSETEFLCQACLEKFRQTAEENRSEVVECELCHTPQTTCRPFRDPEEGFSGPVYTACEHCRNQILRNLEDLVSEEPFGDIEDVFDEDDGFELDPDFDLIDEQTAEDPSNRDEDEKDLVSTEQNS